MRGLVILGVFTQWMGSFFVGIIILVGLRAFFVSIFELGIINKCFLGNFLVLNSFNVKEKNVNFLQMAKTID